MECAAVPKKENPAVKGVTSTAEPRSYIFQDEAGKKRTIPKNVHSKFCQNIVQFRLITISQMFVAGNYTERQHINEVLL